MTATARALALRRPVLADLLPGARVRDAAAVATGAMLTGLCAQLSFHIPGTPVPVTGQTFAVLITGAALGSLRGAASMLLYVLAGLAGVPWFAGGAHGYLGTTAGYLVGFVLAAALVGALARRGADRQVVTAAMAMFAGSLVVYAAGSIGLMVALGISPTTALDLGVRPFLAGDAVKLVAAAAVLPTAWRCLRGNGSAR